MGIGRRLPRVVRPGRVTRIPDRHEGLAMAGDDAAQPPAGAAVLAVLADLRYWADRGVRIAAVEPGDGNGVRIGVREPPHDGAAGAVQPLLVPGDLLVLPVGARSERKRRSQR